MKSGIVVDELMVTFGLFACLIAMKTKTVKINVQQITRTNNKSALAR